ncbi:MULTISPECIES: PLD nuclease N-terminal domain-containing protein [Rhodococcus erythropolis group]|uniref:PLD nuclease N-terminal domain-containing protein n=1 Tax=Rhodococcus baikonurensis TaxID=172041 RepID=A0ABV5XAZ8_9NOCA|nr:PLD nuclease N-terminal domain-containing protein [Rhodococcus qingshengii]
MLNGVAVWALAALLVLYAAAFLTALVTCAGANRLTPTHRAGWLIGILILPLVGPMAWLLYGRHTEPPLA